MRYVLAVRVHNRPGVLLRLANLLYRRNAELHSMTADLPAASAEGYVSLGVDVTAVQATQLCRYLEKLEDVICVDALLQEETFCRELAMLKVPRNGEAGTWLQQGQARLLAETDDGWWLLEISGTPEEITRRQREAAAWGLQESRRTGPLGWAGQSLGQAKGKNEGRE